MDDEEFRAICRDFVERLRAELESFVTSLNDEDFNSLSKQAHWLKGAGGTAGFAVFTRPSRALEDAAREGDAGGCRQMITEIIELTRRISIDAEPAKAVS